jgi:CRISP-associated protein Cas1
MQLYLDSYGAFLNVRNGMFQITPKHNPPTSFATDDVDVIFLTEGVTATSDAMMLALDKGIPIVLLNYLGQAVGQVWSGRFGSIATIRRNQLKFSETLAGWQWMAQTLAQKIDTQRFILQQLPEHYPHLLDKNALIRQGRNCATLDGLAKNLKRYAFGDADFKRMAMEFRAFEATASRHYFRFMASIIPTEKWQFESRSFRPAKDFFNCMLNYLYGMLYAQVELSLIKVGIDPALGVLHVDRYNRPPMVYDFIEPYRHWADWIALELALADAVPEDAFITSFETEGEYSGYWLSSKGKGIVINRFLTYLNEPILYQKKQQKRLIVLDMDAQRLASQLKTLNP